MQIEVYDNIDTLIEMAGGAANAQDITTELITIRRQIKNKKSEISEFQEAMNNTKYFNASDELVDRNIEISLKNKINRLSRKLKEAENDLKKLTADESTLHEDINSLKNKLKKNNNYVKILEEKSKQSSSNDYYLELLNKEKENVASLNSNLAEKEKSYDNILKEIELTNQALFELKNKLTNEQSRLEDILDNLNNPNAYIDEEAKSSDDNKLKKLMDEESELEKRELALLTDASIIGIDAKELIAASEIDGALAKIKELVTIVKSKPFMDINNKSELEELLEKKEEERISLSNLIDSKNYESMNTNAIKERIEYLNKEIEDNTKNIANKESLIKNLDEFINNNLGTKITSLEKEVLALNDTIKQYQELLKEKDNNSKAKTSLEQAINKKIKECHILDDILASYKDDLLSKIDLTNALSNEISNIKSKTDKYATELGNIEKISLNSYQTKDIIEEENDKNELKRLNDEIKELKNRQKYDKNPNELYDQIEMILSTIKPAKKEPIVEEIVLDNTLNEENETKKDSTLIKVIDMIPVETVKASGGNI